MPSDDAYEAVLEELAKLAQAWMTHREVINRAVNQLNHEVIGFTNRLDKDDRARETRQREIDLKLQSIEDGQAGIRKWQAVRLAVEVAVIVAVAAYLFGMSR